MTVRKVYLPKWMSWFAIIMAAGMWVLVTYMVWFAQPEAQREVAGWLVSTAVLLVMAIVVWLMGQRKLPVYVMEEEDGE